MHRLPHQSTKSCSNLESWYEYTRWDWQSGGYDGQEECGHNVNTQGYKYALRVWISPMADMLVFLHRHLGCIFGPGEVTE